MRVVVAPLAAAVALLRKLKNFVTSTDCALAANITSLLYICTLVARKYPPGSLKLTL